jgi:hypothetical protein
MENQILDSLITDKLNETSRLLKDGKYTDAAYARVYVELRNFLLELKEH